MTTLQDFIDIAGQEGHLAVVSTVRADATVQSSVVNVGVLPHPLDGTEVVGFVTYGRAKLANLRRRPQASVTVRSGWTWATAEGRAELFGPDDLHPEVGAERLRLLLRQVFVAAGGSHDDWEAYDRTMAEQRRTVALLIPTRIYSN
jgi:PPOX class probable F420-dependent enzyme